MAKANSIFQSILISAINGRFISLLCMLGISFSSFSQTDSTFFLPNQHPEIMLSGFGFNNSGGSDVFNHCAGIISDGTRLFLCDRWNNRVLIWNTIPQTNLEPDLVLGQKDFNTNDPGSKLDQFDWPGAVSVSSDGKLLIADTYNNRVLVWNTIKNKNTIIVHGRNKYFTSNHNHIRAISPIKIIA